MRSDNGTEFKNTRIEEFCDEHGVKHEFSPKYTPEQNGLVERKNRTLIECARSMMAEYKVSDAFWDEAINTACHAINRLYCHRLLMKTPYELLVGKKPNISNDVRSSLTYKPKIETDIMERSNLRRQHLTTDNKVVQICL